MVIRQVKLFVDAHSFDTCFQGTQTFIRDMYARLLDEPGLDIYWGVANADKLLAQMPMIERDHILTYKKRRISLLRLVFDIPLLIKEYQFDFAHFQYIMPFKQAGCRYIVTTHDVLFNDFPEAFPFSYRVSRNLLFGWSIRNADIRTTVSRYSQQRIAHWFGLQPEQINVTPNGVTRPIITKQKARETIRSRYSLENYILYVSRIEPRKNHAMLLEKYLKLQLYKHGIPLVFIGCESAPVERLQKIIDGLSAEEQTMFHWIPQVDNEDLQAFYSAARLFVYPSKAEGFGIPPLEAAVCRTPVLCSGATAMGDFDFFKPYVFDPEDQSDFEIKLAEIIANPPTESYLENIAGRVLQQYNWQQSAGRFYSLLTITEPQLISFTHPQFTL